MESDFEPRHRILGAIVLVSLGFILFSVVLHEQPQQISPDEKQIAMKPDTRVVVTPMPSPQAQTKPVSVVKSAPKVIINPLAKKPVTESATKSASPTPEKKAIKVDPIPAKKATVTPPKTVSKSTAQRWTVQVGTFSKPANARRLSEKLEQQKYKVTLKVVELKSGRAVRVRVGPFESKASATKARDTIRKKNGIEGVVLALK